MAPLLIDTNGVLKIGITAAIVAVIIFAGGFYLGYYYQADSHRIALRNNHSLSLYEKAISDDRAVEKKRPEKIVESNVASIVKAEPVAKPVKEIVKKTPEKTVAKEPEKTQSPVPKKQQSTTVALSKKQKKVAKSVGDVEAKVKYSIQVGFYGRLDNAEKKVNKLQQENLSAYVTDYINKNNKIRFNVRFGYFVDRSSANTALKAFNKNHKSDGYLVNYTGDKLIHSKEKSNLSEVNAASNIAPDAESKEVVPSKAVVSKDSAPEVMTKTQNTNSENVSVPEIEKTVNR